MSTTRKNAKGTSRGRATSSAGAKKKTSGAGKKKKRAGGATRDKGQATAVAIEPASLEAVWNWLHKRAEHLEPGQAVVFHRFHDERGWLAVEAFGDGKLEVARYVDPDEGELVRTRLERAFVGLTPEQQRELAEAHARQWTEETFERSESELDDLDD